MTEISHGRKVIFTMAVICWMAVIFIFSAKPADESEKMSLSVGKTIGALFISDYSEWTDSRQEEFAGRIDYPVRKSAHASEYAVLGLLLMAMLGGYRQTGAKRIVLSQAVGMIYAAGDEFHQRFVPGRSCQISDVILDSLGVLAGILIFLFVSMCLKQLNSRSISSDWTSYYH